MNERYEDDQTRQNAIEDFERFLTRFEPVTVDRAVATAAASIISELQQQGVHDLHDG